MPIMLNSKSMNIDLNAVWTKTKKEKMLIGRKKKDVQKNAILRSILNCESFLCCK